MKAMRPDQIREQMDKEAQRDLRNAIFVIIMLAVSPIAFIIAIVLSMLN